VCTAAVAKRISLCLRQAPPRHECRECQLRSI